MDSISSDSTFANSLNPGAMPIGGSRENWLQLKRGHQFMLAYRAAAVFPVVVMVLVVGLLYGFVSHWALSAWFFVMVAVNIERFNQTRRYFADLGSIAPERQLQRVHRAQKFALCAPACWGSLAFLYYGQVPQGIQFLCLTVILGICTTAISVLCPHWREHRRYFLVMGLPIMLAMALHLVHQWRGGFALHFADWALLLFSVVFLWLTIGVGERVFLANTRTLELQFEREQLIAELERRTDELSAASTSRSRLLAGAAHDLRQPVHALNLYADWLRSEPEMSAELTPKIVASTAAINALFNSLFEFARVDHGDGAVKLVPMPVCQLAKDMLTQYGPVASAKGLAFRIKVQDGFVKTDALMLRRLLGNLIDNAIKYTEHGGVLFTCRRRGKRYRFDVWDTGIGIPAEHWDHVFGEFFRVQDNPGTQDSFGLGLAIVRRLAKRLGTNVSLVSEPGRGSRFGFELKASRSAERGQ